MSEVGAAESVVSPQKDSGLSFRGLGQVFTSPSVFFQSLKSQPKILVPYIVVGILTLIFLIMTADLILQMQLADPAMQERLQGKPMPETALVMMKYSTIIGGTIVMLLAPIVMALLALFWGNFVFAGKASFKQLLSVMLYGEVVFAAGMMLTLPLILAKESMLASYSLSVLVTQLGPKSVWFVLLSKISVFHIWEFIVVGLGLSTVYGVDSGKGYRLSMLSMGLISVFHVAMTAIFGLFS